jgi:hypothetical protein
LFRGGGGGRKLTLGDGKSWRPLILQDIKTDTTIAVNVRMIDLGGEVDLNRERGDKVISKPPPLLFLYLAVVVVFHPPARSRLLNDLP